MIKRLNSNKLKVGLVTVNTATRGKLNHKYGQTKKKDYNFLLLVFGKAWGYVPKAIGPFTSNPSTNIIAQDSVQKKKSLHSHSDNSKRKESYGRKHKQKIKVIFMK